MNVKTESKSAFKMFGLERLISYYKIFHFFYCCVCTYVVISVAASVIAYTSVSSLISVVE